MYLFFDTETTGLPRNYKAPITDFDNWPRMIQIAWLIYDHRENLLIEKQYIIKPEGFTIPKAASDVHGITTARAKKEGIALSFALQEFAADLHKAEFILAHNISFDEKIVGAEFLRKEISNTLFDLPHICTMHTSTDYCKIPGKFGYKWPNLTELYFKLFGKSFDNAHDALADVKACADCFFELKKLGVFNQNN